MTHASPSRSELRRQLRARRQALSPTQQHQASLGLLRQLMKQPLFMRSYHVALYIAADGEIDPAPVAQQLWKMNKTCYLPVLRPDKAKQMWFVRYDPSTPLNPNSYGIAEPDPFHNHRLPANLLDMVLLPLVGFDRSGARLGMGAGFYDYTFAFKQQKSKGKPYLIGLAHACQEVDQLETASWDVPLHGIATDRELILCGNA